MWWRKSTSRFLQRRKTNKEAPSLPICIAEEAVYKGGIITRSPLHEALRDIFRTHNAKKQSRNGEAPRPQGGELHGKGDNFFITPLIPADKAGLAGCAPGLTLGFPGRAGDLPGRNHLEEISSGGMLTPFSFQNLMAPGWRGIPIFARDSNLGPAVSQ